MRGSLLRSLILFMVLFWAPVQPLLADPAEPTNYRSEVTGIDPPVSEVDAEVVGGDAFLRISAEPGTDLVVLGYRDEPYLWVDSTGAVFQNRNSPATYLNDDRYGNAPVPAGADESAEPEWESIGSGGTWAWHDHRIHWMAPDPPPHLGGELREEVYGWVVPLIVGGERVEVEGRLEWLPDDGPNAAAYLGAIALLPLVLVRRYPIGAPAVATLIASLLGAGAAVGQWAVNPAEARGFPISVAFLALAGGGAVAAIVGRSNRSWSERLLAVSAALLLGWGWSVYPTLLRPVVPTTNPLWFDRIAASAALSAGVAILALVVVRSRRTASQPG